MWLIPFFPFFVDYSVFNPVLENVSAKKENMKKREKSGPGSRDPPSECLIHAAEVWARRSRIGLPSFRGRLIHVSPVCLTSSSEFKTDLAQLEVRVILETARISVSQKARLTPFGCPRFYASQIPLPWSLAPFPLE